MTGGAGLIERQPRARDLGFGERRVRQHAIVAPALLTTQGAEDAPVVFPRDMREGGLTRNVAQCEDAFGRRAQLLVDDDVAALVERDAGPLAVQRGRVWLSAGRDEQRVAADLAPVRERDDDL